MGTAHATGRIADTNSDVIAAWAVRRELISEAFRNAPELVNDGELYGYYEMDEACDGSTFDHLVYSPERREWLARFRPGPNTKCQIAVDLPYGKVQQAIHILHFYRVKPSESVRALLEFHQLFDVKQSLCVEAKWAEMLDPLPTKNERKGSTVVNTISSWFGRLRHRRWAVASRPSKVRR